MAHASPADNKKPRRRHFLDAIRHRPRIYICGAAMVLAYFALPHDIRFATRALLAWNLASLLFIALVGWMMARSSERSIRAHAAIEDEQQWVLLIVGTAAACAALAAIVSELGVVKDMTGWSKAAHIALVTATILTAWTFIHLLFAIHYAHEYYGDEDDDLSTPDVREGLKFPGDRNPTYGDFLYFSFVIGVACQTADVEVSSRDMRLIVVVHGVLAFFFNSAVLALTINIAAGLI